MEFTFYKAKLCTGGKTPEDIRNSNPVWKFSDEDVQNTLGFYNAVNEVIAIVMNSWTGEGYTLVSWDEQYDDRMKEAIYLAEQDPMFGTYIDEREEFDRDWDAGEYEPTGSITFNDAEVEIIEKLKKKGG